MEVCQLAGALTRKWALSRQAALKRDELAALVEKKTAELAGANRLLSSANSELREVLAEKVLAEDQLRHDAFHDKLTGLPNRAMLKQQLDRCIERSKRMRPFQYALLFIDLDNFKIVNDSLGHKAGDELLVSVSRRIANSLRTLDTASRPGTDTASRLGGDEFVVLLDGIRDAAGACTVAERVLEAITQPLTLAGSGVSVSASIGVATSGTDHEQPEDILRDADAAMYAAKRSGKNRWALFDASMHEEAVTKLQLQHDLRSAIDRAQMHLQYQPIVSLESGRIVAFEALLRWNHPGYGPVSPSDFIGVAEESGSMVRIGEWVMREAGRQLTAWRAQLPGLSPLSINVNVSPKQLIDGRFVDQVLALQESLTNIGRLNVELTESTMMTYGPSINSMFRTMKEHGIGIHMDDFGTGYSSLSHLDQIEFDALKIDRSFVLRMQDDRKSAASVQAIVQLAHLRGLTVIAEGLESYDAVVQLQSLDCDLAQGYFFARPLDPADALKLLRAEPQWVRRAA